MKKIISTTAFLGLLCSSVAYANDTDYTVPAIDNGSVGSYDNNPLPLFTEGNGTPLSAKESAALKKSKEWLNGEQYPFKDGHRVTYLYDQSQASVVCSPLQLCIVELEDGERVVEDGIHLGDTARWMVSPAVGGNDRTHVVIKPVEVGLETSLAIVTDRRTYHIRLTSRKNDYMPAVAFHYPQDLQKQWNKYHEEKATQTRRQTIPATGENIADLDFNYSIRGCSSCSWRPLRVYNNGSQTIIQMNKGMDATEAPALLVKTSAGEELVNYRVRGDRYVVDQLFNKAVLVVGVGRHQKKVTITRK